jgi:hypothetical protein
MQNSHDFDRVFMFDEEDNVPGKCVDPAEPQIGKLRVGGFKSRSGAGGIGQADERQFSVLQESDGRFKAIFGDMIRYRFGIPCRLRSPQNSCGHRSTCRVAMDDALLDFGPFIARPLFGGSAVEPLKECSLDLRLLLARGVD